MLSKKLYFRMHSSKSALNKIFARFPFTLILRSNPEKRASFSIDLSPYDYGQWMAPVDNRRWNDEW